MARAKAPKALKFFVDISDDGVPYIGSVEFDHHATADAFMGRSFVPDLGLDDESNPRVRVYLSIPDRYGNPSEIFVSPFTGGAIVTEVNDKKFDEIVAALTPVELAAPDAVDEVVSDDSEVPWDEEEEDVDVHTDEETEDDEELEEEADGEETDEDDIEYEDEEDSDDEDSEDEEDSEEFDEDEYEDEEDEEDDEE